MKREISIFLCCLCSVWMVAQTTNIEPNKRFGKPSEEEMNLSVYTPDTTATAVILYKMTKAHFDWQDDNFILVYDIKTRIKILKEEGIEYANIALPYYSPIGGGPDEEISDIKAASFNLVNGKSVATSMDKSLVFKERINDKYMQVKFTIPQAKVGSVIEFEYQKNSEFYYLIDDWIAQEEIPIVHTYYDIAIPAFFKLNDEIVGTDIATKVSDTKLSFNMRMDMHLGGQQERVTCNAPRIECEVHNVPALKDESFVWCADDYRKKVILEIESYKYGTNPPIQFSTTWDAIEERLRKDEDFGKLFWSTNPLAEEMALLQLDAMGSDEEKIAAIYKLLKSKVQWNGLYRLYGRSFKKILQEGKGSNADINFILTNMLRSAGFTSYPVAMSRRDLGMLPLHHPSINKLNTFVVAVAKENGYYFIDASVENGYIDILPPLLMTNQGRLMFSGDSKWINLEDVGRHRTHHNIDATLLADGTLEGTRQSIYYGQPGTTIRSRYHSCADETEYTNKLSQYLEAEIDDYQSKGINDFSASIQEEIKFRKQASISQEYIYLNPLVFAHLTESPHQASSRLLPVEYPYKEQILQTVTVRLPEGYVVDELPDPLVVQTPDQGIICRYHLNLTGRLLTIRYQFNRNHLFYAQDSYPALKEFYEAVARQNQAQLVLKKE